MTEQLTLLSVEALRTAPLAVRLVVAVTDSDWFEHLRRKLDLAEVNFWAPSGATFRALTPGELFLFKLHAPRNVIVGGGVFAYANALPCSLAWEAFGEANGARSLPAMRTRIARYREAAPDDRSDFVVGCRILTQPFFLPEPRWIPVPASFSRQIVSFKTYATDDADGRMLWNAVQGAMSGATILDASDSNDHAQARFSEPALVRPRLGQGAFRVLVTDTYHRRCAVTGERDPTRARRGPHPALRRGRRARSVERLAAPSRHPLAVRCRLRDGDPVPALRGERAHSGRVRERPPLLRPAWAAYRCAGCSRPPADAGGARLAQRNGLPGLTRPFRVSCCQPSRRAAKARLRRNLPVLPVI